MESLTQRRKARKGFCWLLACDSRKAAKHRKGLSLLATRFALIYPETVDKFILVNPIGFEDWKLKVPYTPR